LEKLHRLVKAIRSNANRRFEFKERRQQFIRPHNETLFVASMRVCDPDRSSVGINR